MSDTPTTPAESELVKPTFSDIVKLVRQHYIDDFHTDIGYAEAANVVDEAIEPYLTALITKEKERAAVEARIDEAKRSYINVGFNVYHTSAEYSNGMEAAKKAHNDGVENRLATLEAKRKELS